MGHSLRLHFFTWCLIQAVLCQTDYTTEVSATELYTAFGTAVDGAVTEDAANALFTGSGSDGTATGTTGTGTGTATGLGSTGLGSAELANVSDSGIDRTVLALNESNEALVHEASEQSSVVFVADPEGYVPIQPVQPVRPTRPAKKSASSSSTSASTASTPSSSPPPPPPGRLQASASDSPEYRAPLETWDRDYRRLRSNNTRVQHIEAECQDDYMKIRIGFNGSFGGLLYSSGYAYDPECVYINGTGRDYYEFYIQLNRCGTLGKNSLGEDSRKNPTKNFMWNTVTVQYNPMIEEEWDEHFKVTCEYGYDFWKTVTFPFLDVEVATGNPVVFTLSPPECYMEIRYGYGTGGTRVTGPVRVGDPLTLIIYMRSKYDGFDIVVNDCWAHNGGNKRIQLIDQYGCPVDDKLISRFRGTWSEQGAFETQVFAYMKTFRFTGSPALYIECDVRMCHGRCPSQPCHWRNAKSVSKRSVGSSPPLGLPGLTGPLGSSLGALGPARTVSSQAGQPTLATSTAPATALSENVNLFQSLRVLQEGETLDGVTSANSTLPDSVCLRSGSFQTLLGLGCSLLCLLASTVLVLCCRVRRLSGGQGKPDRMAAGVGLGSLGSLGHGLGVGLGLGPIGPIEPRFDHGTFMTHKGRIN